MTDQGIAQNATRRRVLTATGATLGGVGILSGAYTATPSGYVEVEIDGEIPDDSTVDVTVQNETSDVEETATFNESHDGGASLALESLPVEEAQYSLVVELSATPDETQSPVVHGVTVAVPAGDTPGPQPDEPDDAPIYDNVLVFITTSVFAFGAIGLASKSMAVASMGSYLLFAYIAVETGISSLVNILYVTLVMVFIGFAFKLWRLEAGGST